MWDACGEAEVNHFSNGLRFIQEDVLEFDVSVCNVPLVTVVDRRDDLPPKELCFQLRHLSVRLHLQVAVQTPSVDVLHDQEDLLVRFKRLVQLGDVLMLELLHDLHLSLDTLSSVRFK